MDAVDLLDGKNRTIRRYNVFTESRRSTHMPEPPESKVVVNVVLYDNVDAATQAEILKEIEDAITDKLKARR
jgi:hypothetical protein|nr:MAG TPA: hypothetical protein [Caudoviricetes sp.]